MNDPLSRWSRLRLWWDRCWKEVILLSAIGLITAAMTLLRLSYLFPLPALR
jgi:hypothetical protein